MKNNILYIYLIYILLVYLLCIIDVTVLIYYIFWINNIFIYPLFWLWVKIIYYNRTILLLLLLYYCIAKFTIKELGYRYIYFFKLDIKKWRFFYLNYIWNITIYHIEIISIFCFFLVIIIPVFLHNKEISILFMMNIVIFLLFFKIIKNKLKYIKNKKVKLKELLIIWFFIYLSIKVFNHQYFKDIMTMYIHLDKWAFNLLEWKIQMYDKIMDKDLYSENIGLKPIWIGEKINEDEVKNNKIWDFLYKKKKSSLVNESIYKLKKVKKKFYLYFKYYEKTLKVKDWLLYKKFEKYKKEKLYRKNHEFFDFNKKIKIKEYTPIVNIENENPVITQEKEKERALHQTILFKRIFKFSINNYYDFNLLLKDLTLNTLYYQPFIDQKSIDKEIINEKKGQFLMNIKEKISDNDDLKLLKKILKKIKKNQKFLDLNLSKSINNEDENENKKYYIIEYFYNYIIFSKKEDNQSKIIFKNLGLDVKINKIKKEKINIENLLNIVKEDIKLKKKLNKYNWLNEYKQNILKEESLKEVVKKKVSNYIERDEIEKNDNQLLLKTVKKYNEEKQKKTWMKEFDDSLILKENKEDLSIVNGPDLSRRNKK